LQIVEFWGLGLVDSFAELAFLARFCTDFSFGQFRFCRLFILVGFWALVGLTPQK
jgi:hypothetical protein